MTRDEQLLPKWQKLQEGNGCRRADGSTNVPDVDPGSPAQERGSGGNVAPPRELPCPALPAVTKLAGEREMTRGEKAECEVCSPVLECTCVQAWHPPWSMCVYYDVYGKLWV